jgi:hypothetical protein
MGSDIIDWLQDREWNQFSAVFLGAFMAFLVGIALQQIAAYHTKRANRRMLRQLIGIEVLEIIEDIEYVARLVRLTRDEGFIGLHSPTSLPRWELLAQALGSQGATALTLVEQADVRAAVANLQTFVGIYETWERSVAPENVSRPVLSQNGTQQTYAELKTEGFLNFVDGIQTNLLDALIFVCNLSKEGGIHHDGVEAVRKKLIPTRPGFPKRKNFGRVYRSALVAKRADKLRERAYLVVWRHDWPDCPIPVIELETSHSKQTEPTLHFRPPNIGGGSR